MSRDPSRPFLSGVLSEPNPEPVHPGGMPIPDYMKDARAPKADLHFRVAGAAPRGRLADHMATFAGRQFRPALLQTLEHAITTVGVSVAILDVLLPERPIVMVNAAFERLSGFAAEEAIGRGLSSLVGGVEAHEADGLLTAAVEEGRATSLSILLGKKDGRPAWTRIQLFPVHENGRLTSIVCILQDIDELIRSEREAHLSKEHLSAVVQRVSELVTILDHAQKITYVNPAVHSILGYDPEELLGRAWLSLVHSSDHSRALAWLGQADAGIDADPLEFQVLHRDGSCRYLEASISVLPGAGQTVRRLISSRDVTDIVALREWQTRLLLEATINGQEEERERICLDIHDGICQTLATAFHYLDMIELDGTDTAEQMARLQRGRELVREGIRQAREIVASLRPARLDALGLVAALRYDVRDLGERTGMAVVFEADALHLNTSVETALYRIVHEALSNAVKHSRASLLRVSLKREQSRLLVVVEDNGVGFSATAGSAPPLEGGVGMISMRRRTELLHGQFDVQSAPGKGTRVHISLPFALATPEP